MEKSLSHQMRISVDTFPTWELTIRDGFQQGTDFTPTDWTGCTARGALLRKGQEIHPLQVSFPLTSPEWGVEEKGFVRISADNLFNLTPGNYEYQVDVTLPSGTKFILIHGHARVDQLLTRS